jgi:hypothetical protein
MPSATAPSAIGSTYSETLHTVSYVVHYIRHQSLFGPGALGRKEGGGAQTPRAGPGLCRSQAARRASASDRTAPGRAAGQGASSPPRASPPGRGPIPAGAGTDRARSAARSIRGRTEAARPRPRGAGKLRRLLELKRTYPAEPFLAAIEQALQYGLFDLNRLERLILERVAGDFFDLDGEP